MGSAWGEVRFADNVTPTDKTYTSQRSYADDFGLIFYNARWYDSSLGRFAQADTIVPPGVQGLDRYAYVNNNPARYVDPSGHLPKEEVCKYFFTCTSEEFLKRYGQAWYDLLWETDTTWGDEITWKNSKGEKQTGALVLLKAGEKYYGVIWGVTGDVVGRPIFAENIEGEVYKTGHQIDAQDLPVTGGMKQCPVSSSSCDGETIEWNYKAYNHYTVNLTWWVVGALAIVPNPGRAVSSFVWLMTNVISNSGAILDSVGVKLPYFYNHTIGTLGNVYPGVELTTDIPDFFQIRFNAPGLMPFFGGNW